ncbi:hypothetical protein D3C81_386880 [compost metagenome]
MNVQPSTQELATQLMPDGTLAVSPLGTVPVTVMFQHDESGAKTAIIAWGGYNQAVITFDATGTIPVGFMLYSVAPTMALQISVQNIVDHLMRTPTLH